MKALSGKGGDTVQDQVPRKITAVFWDRGRAHWGDEVELGTLVTGFKSGTSVKLSVFEVRNPQKSLKDLTASLDGGRAKAKWKIDFEDAAVKQLETYRLFILVDASGVKSVEKQSPILLCDAEPLRFSE